MVGIQATESGRILDEYPSDALRELRKILDVKDRIEVASEFLKIFDITHIVVKNYAATQTTDQNYQALGESPCRPCLKRTRFLARYCPQLAAAKSMATGMNDVTAR